MKRLSFISIYEIRGSGRYASKVAIQSGRPLLGVPAGVVYICSP